MKLFDTHAHLSAPELIPVQQQVIADARSVGVKGICTIATDLTSSYACIAIAEQYEDIYATVGIHPNQGLTATEDQWKEIKQLCGHRKVVGIGETGLDRYWDDCPLDIQRQWFVRHIALSHETGMPLVVHMRQCEQDILDTFREFHRHGQINGIMHSFSGSWETANACLDFGMHVSFAGMVTFKNAADLRDVAKQVPIDRMLIETDSPYLTPHPHRGKQPNQPSMVLHTATCLAKVKGMSLAEFGEITTENARRVFRLQG
jgi:TatD DNase family protein